MNTAIIDKAYDFAKKRHSGQLYSGSPFIFHPLETYKILKAITADENLLAASLLHDVLEDTDTTYLDLVREFNKDVANLVGEVTKTKYNTFPKLKTRRGVMLKFADRLANLNNIFRWDGEKQEKYINKSKFWREK